MPLLIRYPQTQDIPSILSLISELADTAGESSPVTAAYVRDYLASPSSRILLAEIDGRVAGLLSYSIRPDLYHAGDCCLIEELIVREKDRSQGIGKALMDELMTRAAGCREIGAAVAADNARALKFYRSLGFQEESVLLEKHNL